MDIGKPVRGYRIWFAHEEEDGSYRDLRCTGRREIVWPVRQPIEAGCIRRRFLERRGHVRRVRRQRPCRGPVPAPGCSCGIYLAASRRVFDGLMPTRDPMPQIWPELAGGILVLGEAEAWGRVVEHEEGWRSEFARPVRLINPLPSGGELGGYRYALDQLATRYELEVIDDDRFTYGFACGPDVCFDQIWAADHGGKESL